MGKEELTLLRTGKNTQTPMQFRERIGSQAIQGRVEVALPKGVLEIVEQVSSRRYRFGVRNRHIYKWFRLLCLLAVCWRGLHFVVASRILLSLNPINIQFIDIGMIWRAKSFEIRFWQVVNKLVSI